MPTDKLSKTVDQVVSNARKDREQRDTGYRAKALKMYPWICGRCAREFSQQTLHELTVHHRDHDHDITLRTGVIGRCYAFTAMTMSIQGNLIINMAH